MTMLKQRAVEMIAVCQKKNCIMWYSFLKV